MTTTERGALERSLRPTSIDHGRSKLLQFGADPSSAVLLLAFSAGSLALACMLGVIILFGVSRF